MNFRKITNRHIDHREKVNGMSKDLFPEFEGVTAKQWKQKIQYDLKGRDYNDLVWSAPEGIAVNPFYHPDQVRDTYNIPGPEGWTIIEKIYAGEAQPANKKALKALDRGAEGLWLILPSDQIDLEVLFRDINLQEVPIYLEPQFLSADFARRLQSLVKGSSAISLITDVIGNLARTGNWYKDNANDHRELEDMASHSPDFQALISIDTRLYQNAGADIVQQLAYAMAHLNEYLHFLEQKNLQRKARKFLFMTSTGGNYFFEIAKIRTLRILFATLAREYGISERCHILAQPSRRNKTLYDFNVNLLRTTTECMSAITGGADSICNMAYDEIYHKDNDFGRRIARNQLLILKHEAYFGKVADPAAGSFYLERLTGQFAEKALELFKQIEAGGGFLHMLKEGTVQRKIKEQADLEQEMFDQGRLTLIGTNKYLNPEDRMQGELELFPFVKRKSRKTFLPPVVEKRISEDLEQRRLQEEKEQ